MLYLSYGSNMSEKRLLRRITAVKRGTATLHGYRLCFRKKSESDQSAKCDILETGMAGDFVLGVVYDVEDSQKKLLDEFEGLGYGYDSRTVKVKLAGRIVEVFTYYATSIDPSLKPLKWYKRHVLEGAIENGFPQNYISFIESIETVSDTDTSRRERELSIYS